MSSNDYYCSFSFRLYQKCQINWDAHLPAQNGKWRHKSVNTATDFINFHCRSITVVLCNSWKYRHTRKFWQLWWLFWFLIISYLNKYFIWFVCRKTLNALFFKLWIRGKIWCIFICNTNIYWFIKAYKSTKQTLMVCCNELAYLILENIKEVGKTSVELFLKFPTHAF